MSSWRPSIPTLDRISDLPDSLLCHILSFVPTKLAVTTSVLSKRWSLVWRSVLTLNFEDKPFENFDTFHNIVDSVIKSRDTTLPLLSFRIKSHNTYDYNALSTATVCSLLTCKTLVVLKLNNLIIDYVPQLVDLSLLKSLHLVSIFFINYEHFKRLLDGCPTLEKLKTNDLHTRYNYNYMRSNCKAFPKLVSANFSNFEWANFTFDWFLNVKFLRVELVSTYGLQVPTFHKLTNLEIIFKNHVPWLDKWIWVIQVLQHCPKLQHLTVDEASQDIPEYRDWEDPKIVPECLSSQFRSCTLKGLGYYDIECELQFAKYIMLNSQLLCTMTIKSSSLLPKKARDQMLVRISSFPRGSAACKLLVD